VAVFLTPKGREAAREHYQMITHFASELFRRLGERDTMELLRLADRAESIFLELHQDHGPDQHCPHSCTGKG
jgi:DNA-binding MarR family transcriptional regulator